MREENKTALLGLSIDKSRFHAIKLAIGLFFFMSGFYLMSKNQDIMGMIVVAVGMFIILI